MKVVWNILATEKMSKSKHIDLTVIRRITAQLPEHSLEELIDFVKNYPSENDMDENEVIDLIKKNKK